MSPWSLSFADQLVGTTSAPGTLTIRNAGNGALTMSRAIVGPNAGDFRLAALQITSNAVGSPHRVSLSGRGCRLIVARAGIRICL